MSDSPVTHPIFRSFPIKNNELIRWHIDCDNWVKELESHLDDYIKIIETKQRYVSANNIKHAYALKKIITRKKVNETDSENEKPEDKFSAIITQLQVISYKVPKRGFWRKKSHLNKLSRIALNSHQTWETLNNQRQEIKKLKDEYKRLTELSEELDIKITQKNKDELNYKAQSSIHAANETKLKKEIETLKATLLSCENSIQQHLSTITAKTKEIEALKENNEISLKEVKETYDGDLQKNLKNFAANNKSFAEQLEKLQREKREIEENNERLLQGQQKSYTELLTKLGHEKENNERLQQEKQRLYMEQLKKLECEKKDLEESKERLQQEKKALNDKIIQLSEFIYTKQDVYKDLNAELEMFQECARQHKSADVEEIPEDLKGLQERCEKLEHEKTQLFVKITLGEKNIRDLDNANKQLTEINKKAQQRIKEAQESKSLLDYIKQWLIDIFGPDLAKLITDKAKKSSDIPQWKIDIFKNTLGFMGGKETQKKFENKVHSLLNDTKTTDFTKSVKTQFGLLDS